MPQAALTASIDDRSTCQRIAQYARERPDAAAIVERGRRTSYRALATQIVQAMRALTEAGIRSGQVVGIESSDRHSHLLVMLACATLDAATISLGAGEVDPPFVLRRLCDRIVVSKPFPAMDPDKDLVMTPEWLAHVLETPEVPPSLDALDRQPRAEDLVRLIRSSGTTGAPKVMRMTHRIHQRVAHDFLSLAADRILPHPDFLGLYNFTVRSFTVRAMITLQLGGTVHFTTEEQTWRLIEMRAVNYAMFMTGDLERLVRTFPRDRGPFDLHIDAIGAPASFRLRQEVREVLTDNLFVRYGTNEVNSVALADENGVGTLSPGVEVMIVDEDGQPVPLGAQGVIRVRHDAMMDSYIGEPELTRAAFIDGWYHTNDIGFQPAPGKLIVLGRADDLLNLGGPKIDPAPIEERLRAIEGVRDAMITTVPDDLGSTVVLVVLETGPAGCTAELVRSITPAISLYTASFQVLGLPVFPRTETGKVRRRAIRDDYLMLSRTGTAAR